MAAFPRKTLAVVVLAIPAALTGCRGSSASFPFDRDTVWRAAVGETIVWRPNLIDPDKYIVQSTKTDLGGSEYRYELRVAPDLNIFARRPSTRVHVRMQQALPETVRFKRLEREFLAGLKAKLAELSPPAGR